MIETLIENSKAKLSCYTNGTDHIIAYSAWDALCLWCDKVSKDPFVCHIEIFQLVPEDKPLTISNKKEDPYCIGFNPINLSIKEWIVEAGRGFLCSKEY